MYLVDFEDSGLAGAAARSLEEEFGLSFDVDQIREAILVSSFASLPEKSLLFAAVHVAAGRLGVGWEDVVRAHQLAVDAWEASEVVGVPVVEFDGWAEGRPWSPWAVFAWGQARRALVSASQSCCVTSHSHTDCLHKLLLAM